MIEIITSLHNPKIKRLQELQQKSRARRDSGLFVLEGRREMEHCVEAGFRITSVFICPEIYFSDADASIGQCRLETGPSSDVLSSDALVGPLMSGGVSVFSVSSEIYSRLAYREGTEGIIAEVEARYPGLDDIPLNKPRTGSKPLVIVLEAVEKPGNLGAVLRSADAAGADAVIICDPLTDLYNPNLIRAAIGAVFTVPTVVCSSEDAIKWLKANNFAILTAQLQDSELYYDTPMTEACAIVMGTESTGLTDKWRAAATAHIRIPMLGRLDSLNVSVSAAILLYEAARQRHA